MGQTDTDPLVWRTNWSLNPTPQDQGGMALSEWKTRLDPAMSLRAPERLLGVPWRHHLARITGQWERRLASDGVPPTGSATPFDPLSLVQSQVWMSAQLQRQGFLDGNIQMDTVVQGPHITLQVALDPGRRLAIGQVVVEDQGSGLSEVAMSRVQGEWKAWEGRWMDLDAMDRTRSEVASMLQGAGWYGFLAEHMTVDLDTAGSRATGLADMSVRLLPSRAAGIVRPHRISRIAEVTVSWPDTTSGLTTRQENGILWRTPPARDIRILERNVLVEPGDLFDPKRLTDTRQRLRSLPMAERVDLELVRLLDSTSMRERQLGAVYRILPAPKQVMRVKGGLTSRQGPGGEIQWTYSQVDFRRSAEELNLNLQAGLETVTPYLGSDSVAGTTEPFLNSRVLSAGIEYATRRLIPFGPQRFSQSNRPQSRLSLQWRDENRPKFSRTFIQVGLVEQFIENPATGSKLELRPFELAMTASRLQPGFVQELNDIGSGFLVSSFESRALFASGLSWWLQPSQRANGIRFRLHLEAEAAGHLFHALDARSPVETAIPLPSLLGSGSEVQVARYSRWVLDLRWDWLRNNRNGLHARLYTGVVSSSIAGSAPPLEKQFYVGGPNSLRGWRALGLGPGGAGEQGVNVRGDVRLEANVEARHFINDWIQLAAFVDAGNIWMVQADEAQPLAHFEWRRFPRELGVSAGAGVRLDFGYFLLRCDAARPVRWPEGMSPTMVRWRIHPAVSLPF